MSKNNSNDTVQVKPENRSKQVLIIIAVIALLAVAIITFAIDQSNTDKNTGEFDPALNVTYIQESPEETTSAPDTSSPTY